MTDWIKSHMSDWGYLWLDICPDESIHGASKWYTIGIDLYNKEFC